MPKKFVRETSAASENLGCENIKFLHKRGISLFLVENIFFTVPKNFVGNPSLPEKIWYGKNLWIKMGVSQFSIDSF